MTTDLRYHVFVNCNHRFWWQKPFITWRYLPTTQWTFLWHSPIYFKSSKYCLSVQFHNQKIYSLWLCLQSKMALAGTHHSNYQHSNSGVIIAQRIKPSECFLLFSLFSLPLCSTSPSYYLHSLSIPAQTYFIRCSNEDHFRPRCFGYYG